MYIVIGCALFLTILLSPTPDSLLECVDTPGIPGYSKLAEDETIAEHLSYKILGPVSDGLTPEETAYKAKCMVAILAVSGVFWATAALPLGVTAFLLGFLMYLLGVLPPDMIAKSYMKDAVFFIIGALSLASGVHKTGFDKRLGLILLGRVKNRKSYLFVFGPLVAIVACFISAKCLIAFLVPVLVGVYSRTIKDEGLERYRPLGTFLILVLVYCTAMGGTGAPTSGRETRS